MFLSISLRKYLGQTHHISFHSYEILESDSCGTRIHGIAQVRVTTRAQDVSRWFLWWVEDQAMFQNGWEVVHTPEVPLDAEWRSPEVGHGHSTWSVLVGSSVLTEERAMPQTKITQVTKTLLPESYWTKFMFSLHQLYSTGLYQLDLVLL